MDAEGYLRQRMPGNGDKDLFAKKEENGKPTRKVLRMTIKYKNRLIVEANRANDNRKC